MRTKTLNTIAGPLVMITAVTTSVGAESMPVAKTAPANAIIVAQSSAVRVTADPATQNDLGDFTNAEEITVRRAAWQRVRASADTNPTAVIQQIALFAHQPDDPRAPLAAGSMIRELAFSNAQMCRALIPLLDSDEPDLRAHAGNLLAAYEDASADRPPNFAVYRDIIATAVRENQPVSAGLVRHMYATDPGQALCTMVRASGIREPDRLRPILWAEHAVADTLWQQRHGFIERTEVLPPAAQALGNLANHEQWWARLYVAAIVQQYPSLRQADTQERLREDAHPLVAKFARGL
jgi:hypothetical protein